MVNKGFSFQNVSGWKQISVKLYKKPNISNSGAGALLLGCRVVTFLAATMPFCALSPVLVAFQRI